MLNRLFRGRITSKDTVLPKSVDFDLFEKKLGDPCATPISLPLDFLKSITCDFSQEQELGRGGFGVVYKGLLRNRKTIAVKKLSGMHLDDDQFHNEVTYLIGLKHENIVQLIGYCAESRWDAIEVDDKYVMGEIRHRLICFEYVSNRSLDKYLSDESCGLEWQKRFEIIRRICCDFGMSRLFGQQQSRIITQSRKGTPGYMAPEYLVNGLISTKSDIFRLGVIIIELLIGSKDYAQSTEASLGHFVENVVHRWRNTLEKTWKYIPLELYCQQVDACIKIGMKCVDPNPEKRPAAWDIIEILNATESKNRCSGMSGGQIVDKTNKKATQSTTRRQITALTILLEFSIDNHPLTG
ncbi:hypothetical protein BS78_05G077900 [Paspalum vaginatum]|nr:hypothetical protein BS78_05G077900 [Paspalum vaginatum]